MLKRVRDVVVAARGSDGGWTLFDILKPCVGVAQLIALEAAWDELDRATEEILERVNQWCTLQSRQPGTLPERTADTEHGLYRVPPDLLPKGSRIGPVP